MSVRPPRPSSLLRFLSRFRRGAAGNVAIIFGLAATPLVLAAGAAVDYSRAAGLHTSLQVATDATALILCRASPTMTTAQLRTMAQANLTSYVKDGAVTISDLQVANSPRSVVLKTSSSSPTAFMKIVNQTTVPVAAAAACAASEQYFEIALVLDTTGSMASAGGSGQTKMEAAKTAAKDFVDYMYTTGALPGRVRMSLVPFAATVALPAALRTASWLDTTAASPIHWQFVTGASAQNFASRLSIFTQLRKTSTDWDWTGCVESPVYPFNTTDAPSRTSTPKSLIVPLFAPDEVGNSSTCTAWGYSYACQDPANLNSYIDDGTGTGTANASCRSDDSSTSRRFTQACKYNSRRNARTGVDGPNSACTSRPLSTLGTAQSSLKSEIDALQPEGSTNIHEGFMWGWRTVSPESVFASQTSPPVAYGTASYNKVVVLMTDGTNQWLSNGTTVGRSRYSAYGYFRNADGTDATSANSRLISGRTNLTTDSDGRAAIDELLAESCANAKRKGVIVYTVGFSTSSDPIDAQGLSLLSNCSSGSDYAFVANDSSSLITAFDRIAKGIGQLRLTR